MSAERLRDRECTYIGDTQCPQLRIDLGKRRVLTNALCTEGLYGSVHNPQCHRGHHKLSVQLLSAIVQLANEVMTYLGDTNLLKCTFCLSSVNLRND